MEQPCHYVILKTGITSIVICAFNNVIDNDDEILDSNLEDMFK